MLVRVSSGRGSVRSILNYTLLILCVGIQGPEALSYCSPPQSIEGTIEAMVTVTCLVDYVNVTGCLLLIASMGQEARHKASRMFAVEK